MFLSLLLAGIFNTGPPPRHIRPQPHPFYRTCEVISFKDEIEKKKSNQLNELSDYQGYFC